MEIIVGTIVATPLSHVRHRIRYIPVFKSATSPVDPSRALVENASQNSCHSSELFWWVGSGER